MGPQHITLRTRSVYSKWTKQKQDNINDQLPVTCWQTTVPALLSISPLNTLHPHDAPTLYPNHTYRSSPLPSPTHSTSQVLMYIINRFHSKCPSCTIFWYTKFVTLFCFWVSALVRSHVCVCGAPEKCYNAEGARYLTPYWKRSLLVNILPY